MINVNDIKSDKLITPEIMPHTLSQVAGNGKLYKIFAEIPVPMTEAKKTGRE